MMITNGNFEKHCLYLTCSFIHLTTDDSYVVIKQQCNVSYAFK